MWDKLGSLTHKAGPRGRQRGPCVLISAQPQARGASAPCVTHAPPPPRGDTSAGTPHGVGTVLRGSCWGTLSCEHPARSRGPLVFSHVVPPVPHPCGRDGNEDVNNRRPNTLGKPRPRSVGDRTYRQAQGSDPLRCREHRARSALRAGGLRYDVTEVPTGVRHLPVTRNAASRKNVGAVG